MLISALSAKSYLLIGIYLGASTTFILTKLLNPKREDKSQRNAARFDRPTETPTVVMPTIEKAFRPGSFPNAAMDKDERLQELFIQEQPTASLANDQDIASRLEQGQLQTLEKRQTLDSPSPREVYPDSSIPGIRLLEPQQPLDLQVPSAKSFERDGVANEAASLSTPAERLTPTELPYGASSDIDALSRSQKSLGVTEATDDGWILGLRAIGQSTDLTPHLNVPPIPRFDE
jgi:hypothetical protein